MDVSRWLTLLREDGRVLAETARHDLDAPVPTCPGWTVRDVVVHTGSVYAHKVAAMEAGRCPEPGSSPAAPEGDEDPVDWFVTQHDRLQAALTARDAGAQTWTWYPGDSTVGFWYRRMAHETAVHRVDVQSAFDDVTPVDGPLAVDGVDELLAVFMLTDAEGETVGGRGQRVVVRTGEHAWRTTLRPSGVDLDHEAVPADATVSSEPSELYLYLWGRRPESAVHVDGDVEAARALRTLLVACTQ